MSDHVHDCPSCGGYWTCDDPNCEEEQVAECFECRLLVTKAQLELAIQDRDDAYARCDGLDAKLTAVRTALKEAGCVQVELYPETDEVSDYDRSLCVAGRCVSLDGQVRRLAKERDDALALRTQG